MPTDVKDRGIPWMRLLLPEGKLGQRRSLNLKPIEKINTALVGLAVLALAAAVALRDPRWLLVVPAVAAFVGLANLRFYGFLVRAGGLGFALGAFQIHLLYYIVNGVCAAGGYVAHHLIGEPAPGGGGAGLRRGRGASLAADPGAGPDRGLGAAMTRGQRYL